MMRSQFFAAVLLELLCYSAWGDEPPAENVAPGSWAPAGLRMELNAVRETVTAGDDVELELAITNTSDKPVPIWMRPDDDPEKNGKFASVVALVDAPDGVKTRLQRPTNCKSYLELLIMWSTNLTPPPPPDYPQLVLKPGDIHRETIVPGAWKTAGEPLGFPRAPAGEEASDLATPGKYTFCCEYYHYPAAPVFNGKSVPLLQVPSAAYEDAGERKPIDPKDMRVESNSVTITVLAKEKPAEHRQPAAKPASREAYLQSQIQGLLKEAEALRAAGRLEEARQHAEKAIYRIGQLQELRQADDKEARPEQEEAAAPKPEEDAGDAKLWSKEIGGLKMRIAPSREVYRLGDDVQLDLLLKNVSDKEVQTWAFRETAFDSYPATSFVVDTPEAKQVVVGKVELNSNELRFLPRLSLKPGETTRQTVLLNKWSINFLGPRSLQTLGVYRARCYHYLDPLGDPYGFPHERTAESAIPVERALLKSPPVRLTIVAENADVNAPGENQAGARAKVDALKARIKRRGVQLDESMPAAAVPGKKPQPKGLALEVEFERREHLLAEPVLLRCSLTNYGDEPITLSYGHRAEQQNTIFFDIIGPDGKPVPWSNDLRIDSPGPQPLVIPAGRRYVEMYNLVDCYDLTRPGTYKINVRYESDGRSFNASSLQWREDLWKGKLERPAGALKIVEPTRPEDKAALDALLSKATYGADSPFRFLYLFHGESSESFDAFLREHSASRYAPYARFGNALAALRRVQNGTPSYAAAAIANLEAIDPAGCPALFAEQRLFHLIEAHLAAESPSDQVNPLVERLLSKYPHSPLLSSS